MGSCGGRGGAGELGWQGGKGKRGEGELGWQGGAVSGRGGAAEASHVGKGHLRRRCTQMRAGLSGRGAGRAAMCGSQVRSMWALAA